MWNSIVSVPDHCLFWLEFDETQACVFIAVDRIYKSCANHTSELLRERIRPNQAKGRDSDILRLLA